MGLKKIKLENKEYNVSILDLLRLLDPSKTGKFMTILLNELKFYNKSVPLGHRDIKQLSNQIETSNVIHEELLGVLIECVGGTDVINDLEKFEVLCDEGLVEVIDIQEYRSIGELSLTVIDAEEKRKDRDSTPQKEIVFDLPDYLLLKPLNEFASKKYGASTKWCTSSRDPKTFYQYSENGVLIYILPKNDNPKWAVYYDMGLKELSWWNTKDILTDGYLVDLPEQLKKDILKYILDEQNPNGYYFDEKAKALSKDHLLHELTPPNDIDDIDSLVYPTQTGGLSVVWPTLTTTDNNYNTTTTSSSVKIDSMVSKTMEYYYTIDALNKGGEEL